MVNSINNGGCCQPSNGAVGEKTSVESTPQNSTPQANEPAMGVIYKITNTLNGKFYVGKTKQKLEKRMAQHRYESKKGSIGLGAAIRKYGWENFTVEVLEVCPDEKLSEREIFFIAELDCKSPKGYNLTDGGEGLVNPSDETRAKMSANHPDVSGEKNPNFGKKTPPETCAKISVSNKGKHSERKGKKNSPETCAKISANHADVSGEKNPNFGKKTPPETLAKMSASKLGEKNPNYGKPRPPETCAKIAAGVKAALAKKKLENGGNK